MASVGKLHQLGLLRMFLMALLMSQASLLFQPAWARAFGADRGSLATPDNVTVPENMENKEKEITTAKDKTVGSSYWGGGGGYGHGGGGYGHGGGGYGHGGGGYGHGGGGYGHGGGGYGHGGGGYGHGHGDSLDHKDEKKP